MSRADVSRHLSTAAAAQSPASPRDSPAPALNGTRSIRSATVLQHTDVEGEKLTLMCVKLAQLVQTHYKREALVRYRRDQLAALEDEFETEAAKLAGPSQEEAEQMMAARLGYKRGQVRNSLPVTRRPSFLR